MSALQNRTLCTFGFRQSHKFIDAAGSFGMRWMVRASQSCHRCRNWCMAWLDESSAGDRRQELIVAIIIIIIIILTVIMRILCVCIICDGVN